MDKSGLNEETGLYNSDIKMYFIEEKRREGVSEYAIISYLSTFKKIADSETMLDKDMGDFNRFEFGDLLIAISAKSYKSIISAFSNLKVYDQWLSSEGYLGGRTPVTTFFTRRDLDKYIFTPNKFISWEEILDIEVVNEQDVANLYLLYDSIKGENNCEIVNMKFEHLDFENNIINIIDENDKLIRKAKVHKETMEIVRRAFFQKEYYKTKKIKELNINMESEEITLKSVMYELPSGSPYIMRRGIKEASGKSTKKDYPTDYDGMRPIPGTTINARVKKIAKEINKFYLNTTTIHQSGMLHRLKEIEDKKGFLTTADYAEVLVNAGGNEVNAHSLKILYLTSFNPDSSDSIKLFKKKR
jgi:integrase